MWSSDPIKQRERPLHQRNYVDLNWVFRLTPATPDTAQPLLQQERLNAAGELEWHLSYNCSRCLPLFIDVSCSLPSFPAFEGLV